MTEQPVIGPGATPRWRGAIRRAAPWLIGLAIAMCWDRAVYLHVRVGGNTKSAEAAAIAVEAMERSGWYRFLWVLGRAELWLVVAAALLFADFGVEAGRSRRGVRRAVFLVLGMGLSGAATELGKLVFRRLRPDQTEGWYQFRPWSEAFWSAKNLGLPSSHAGVVFGAAFALCWMFPRAAPVFICAGVGCSLSRLLAGAHFLSDVLVGTAIAFFVVLGVYALDRRNNGGRGIEEL
jgi:membrane-associated phospholipid phosphatase